jgi:hypothetical protein
MTLMKLNGYGAEEIDALAPSSPTSALLNPKTPVMDEKRGSVRGSSRGGRENIQGESYVYMHVCKLKLGI